MKKKKMFFYVCLTRSRIVHRCYILCVKFKKKKNKTLNIIESLKTPSTRRKIAKTLRLRLFFFKLLPFFLPLPCQEPRVLARRAL